jgi:hypothetical protein
MSVKASVQMICARKTHSSSLLICSDRVFLSCNPFSRKEKRVKRLIALMLVLTFMTLSSSALAATFKMKDGTSLVGQLAERTIKMRTSYGEASFKTQDIVSYQDGILKLRDGNTVKGTILNRSLKVKTATSSFVIDPEKILSFEP